MPSVCRINVIAGQETDKVFTISDQIEAVIGRHSKCLIKVVNNEISRRQARITKQGDDWVIEPLSRKIPTVVSGDAIEEPTVLKDADRILVGSTLLEFKVEAS